MSKRDLNHLISREVENFIVDRRAKKLSPKTIEFYGGELRLWLGYLSSVQGVKDIEELTAQHIREYLIHLGETRNPGGIHAAYRTIGVFLRWWKKETDDERWKNPIDKVGPPEEQEEHVTDDERGQILVLAEQLIEPELSAKARLVIAAQIRLVLGLKIIWM